MKYRGYFLALTLTAALATPSVSLAAQSSSASSSRDITRDRLVALLTTVGKRSDVNIDFHQSTKNPYAVAGIQRAGLKNADYLEVVASATKDETISIRVFPHYNDGYINIDKVRDYPGFMRTLLKLNSTNFLYWGADESGDVFAAYPFTMESGFPAEAITVVVRSINNQDQYVGQLRPYIDGTSAK